MKDHEAFMREALKLARRAGQKGEAPVGALLVQGNRVLGRGYNLRESRQSPSAHAELLAIEKTARKLGTWRLNETRLYVTLEPCLMCWGAIVLARVGQVIFGARDPKAGVCGSMLSLHLEDKFNHRPAVTPGILAEDCGRLLSDFFRSLREKKGKSDSFGKQKTL